MFRINRGTVGGYFLAGRTMTWWPVSSMQTWTDKDIPQYDLISVSLYVGRQ